MLSSSDEVADDKTKTMKSGNCRSVIRMIGSTLPLSNIQRPKFELLPNGARLIDEEQHETYTFSDIRQLIELPNTLINSFSSNNLKAADKDDITPNPSDPITPTPTTTADPAAPNHEMVNKISALEDELSQLRSQIALLVSNQAKHQEQMSASFTAPSVEPSSTSTPLRGSVPPPPPLPSSIPIPPPPPLPPMMSSKETKPNDTLELIRQRKKARAESTTAEKPKAVLSMSEVLKDLHKVKLKSVTRSPGGTPLNPKKLAPKEESATGDPAAFIAAALRKKFAHRQNCTDSPDGANELGLRPIPIREKEWEETSPKFGQHLLKKRPPPVPAK